MHVKVSKKWLSVWSIALLYVFVASVRLQAEPSIESIPNLTVPAGKSVVIPVFGTTTNGWTLSYTAESDHPTAVRPRVHHDNPWLKLSVTNFGEMTFMLFKDRTPNTVEFIRGLADTAFYNDLTFHRVVPSFVIQSGDPVGDGTGGPDFTFQDEFDPTLLFTGAGQLAMANSGKDSNGSQFFVTLGPQRFLDFNHTIFGQLVRGFDVLAKIAAVPTQNSAPITPVVISRAGTVTNYGDTVLTLLASSDVGTTAVITLTAVDGHGGKFTRTFQTRVTADPVDDPVILLPPTNRIGAVNFPVAIPIETVDLESNPANYGAQLLADSTNHATLSLSSNVLTVTPAAGYVGPLYCLIGARQAGATSRGSSSNPYDIQVVTVGVGASPIIASSTNLLSVPDFVLLNRRVAHFTSTDLTRTATNFAASIIWGDFRATDGDIVKLADGTFVVLGSHRYLTPGTFRIVVDISDDLGATAHVESSATVLPSLSLGKLGGSSSVSWPFSAAGFQLESASDLGAHTVWQPVGFTAEEGSFDIKYLVGETDGRLFLRLRK